VIFLKSKKQINKRIRDNRIVDSDETAYYEGEPINMSQMK
jgi:hypothetical protein